MEVCLVRKVLRRTGKTADQIQHIVEKSRLNGWQAKVQHSEPYLENEQWVYSCKITYDKKSGNQSNIDSQFDKILTKIAKLCKRPQFANSPWIISNQLPIQKIENKPDIKVQPHDVKTSAVSAKVLSAKEIRAKFEELALPLLSDEAAISNSEYFKDIFSREPQIRVVLSSIWSALQTNFSRRNHCVLYGLPACAKTQILLNIEEMFGPGSVLRIDATSATKAGIENLFFKELVDIPLITVIEEIEKTSEEVLRVWLGAMDARGEIRKITFRKTEIREIKTLCFATANDKLALDKLMGGTEKHPGPLSSRFVHQLYCPRPDRNVLSKILHRDIKKYGGKEEWIEPALDLAEELNTNDPRRVLGFLDGGDRLLTGKYQQDMLHIRDLAKGQQ